jgi:hypothetical protein
MPSTFLRASRHAKILGIARRGSLEEGDIEPRVRVIFSRAVAPRTERITQVNGTGMPEDSVKIDGNYPGRLRAPMSLAFTAFLGRG